MIAGQPLLEDQDPGRLLLLCVRAARAEVGPCTLRRGDGVGYDRRHSVSFKPQQTKVLRNCAVGGSGEEICPSTQTFKGPGSATTLF